MTALSYASMQSVVRQYLKLALERAARHGQACLAMPECGTTRAKLVVESLLLGETVGPSEQPW